MSHRDTSPMLVWVLTVYLCSTCVEDVDTVLTRPVLKLMYNNNIDHCMLFIEHLDGLFEAILSSEAT